MDARGYQNYKQQSINSMTPGELLLLLYDELVKRSTLLDRCADIVNYLDETLDRQYPISHDLSRMYDYFTYELGRIKVGRNKKELERLRPMLVDMRDTFRTAEKNSSQEKQA